MNPLLDMLFVVWGRMAYLIGAPIQNFGDWAWKHTAYYLLAPELELLAAILIICLVVVFTKKEPYLFACWIAIVALVINFLMTVHMMYYTSRYFTYGLGLWWGGLETLDPYAIFFKQLMDWGDILLMLVLIPYKQVKKYRVEFIILMLTGTIAFDLMVGSSDLLAIYVMTEFGGLCSYILAAMYKKNLRSLESGLKYFIYGSASSTCLLFGMSILYGAVNTTNIYEIKDALNGGGAMLPPVILAIIMIIVAFGYKVGIAPFHLWVADVYEGAPTPVTAFMSVFPKVAGYAVMLRLLFIAFAPLEEVWVPVLVVMAILSMAIGNVMALQQTSFKRMMAFSGIGHMGYIMIALVAAANVSGGGEPESMGFLSAMYYMLVYFFMNLGIFFTAMAVETYGGSDHLDSYNGLIKRNAFMTVLITVLLASLIGLPPTTGFIAKFLVFYSYIYMFYHEPWKLVLVVVALITTAIGAYYYMKLAYRMWVLPPAPEFNRRFEPALFMRTAVLLPTLLIFILGFLFVHVPFEYVKGAWFLKNSGQTGAGY
jgi:NADH-quinone oxidoreductase subunit N